MKSSNIRFFLVLSSFLFFATTLSSQDKEQIPWHKKVMDWVTGIPKDYEESVPTNHIKHLIGYSPTEGVLDEYLSPILHTGWGLKYRALRDYYAPADRNLHLYDELVVDGGIKKNPANGSEIYQIGAEYLIGPLWRVLKHDRFSFDVGALLNLYLYGNFKLSNTNNVANAKASIGADAWARARYELPASWLHLGLSYSVQLPLLHCTFHPDFGESYYEYVSGENGQSLPIYFASLHNAFSFRQRLLIDMPISSVTVTAGVEHNYRTERFSHTKYQRGGVAFLIGISLDYMSFSGANSRSSNLKSSYYTR